MSPHGAGDDRDPAMTRLMEDWGASVRRGTERGRIFERPPELPALDARLDAIDAELSSVAAAQPFATRRLRIAAATAAAAAVLVATAWLAFRGDVRAPGLAALRAVPVVESGGVARSAPPAFFRTGDRIDLRFETDAPASVRIASCGAGNALRLVAAEAIDTAGPRSIGPFVFEGEPGIETFVVIAGPRDAAPGDFDALLAMATEAARAAPERALDAALERIRRDGRYSAEALALRHER